GRAPSRVLVIDEDLGHSASGADARPGFSRLVAEVGLDHVGIVLGIEMSRLARSGREWHQLLELCALSGALLGDLDGVYDPAEHRPSRAGVGNMLRNPAYAGIYAYGRSTLDPRRRQPGRPCTGRVRLGRDAWLVFLPGVLPAYISVEQYERNMARLDANRSRAQRLGAVRDGPALLAGLVACGRCGKKMTVRYQRGRGGKLHPVYVCSRAKSDYAADRCQ